jgi:hypothetical protein
MEGIYEQNTSKKNTVKHGQPREMRQIVAKTSNLSLGLEPGGDASEDILCVYKCINSMFYATGVFSCSLKSKERWS